MVEVQSIRECEGCESLMFPGEEMYSHPRLGMVCPACFAGASVRFGGLVFAR